MRCCIRGIELWYRDVVSDRLTCYAIAATDLHAMRLQQQELVAWNTVTPHGILYDINIHIHICVYSYTYIYIYVYMM